MRTDRHMKKISLVFIKILAIFLIVIFPIYLSGLYINFIGQKDLETEKINSSKPKIDFYANRLEKDFRIVTQSVSRLVNNEDVKYLSLTENQAEGYDKMKAILDLWVRLREIRDQGEFISEVCIYIPMIHKKISSDFIQDFPPGEFEMFTALARDTKLPFLYIDSQKIKGSPNDTGKGVDIYMCVMPYFSDIMVAGQKQPLYIVTIKVNKEAVSKMLKEYSGNVQGNGILLGGKNGLDFTEGINTEIAGSLRKVIITEDSADAKTTVTTTDVQGKNYIVAYKKITALDSTLLMYIPQESFFNSLVRYRSWLWIVSLLTVFLVLLFTMLVRSHIYQAVGFTGQRLCTGGERYARH